MPAVVERGESARSPAAAEAMRTVRAWAGPALATALAGTVAAAVLAGGGSDSQRLYPLGVAVLVLGAGTACAALLGLLPRPRLDRPGAACVGLLAAFAVWTAVTVLWSTLPDRSWDFFNRTLVYLAFLVLGLAVGATLRRSVSRTAAALSAIVAVALVWALAGKVIPALFPDGARVARLREPIGYWNALALLFAVGLPLALWLASRREHDLAVRAVAVTGLFALVVAILLTYSRGGVIAGAVAVAAWLVVGGPRLESLAAIIVATPAALAVAKWTFGRPGVVDDSQPHAARVTDGWHFGVVLVVAGLTVFAVAYLLARWEARHRWPAARRVRVARRVGLALGVIAVVALVVVAARGDPLAKLDARLSASGGSCEQVTQNPSRLTDFSLNQRWCWWTEAWRGFKDEPLRGTGAGAFETTHLAYRGSNLAVSEPHNLPLQLLSETGIVGFLLGVGGAAAGLIAIAATLRRISGAERAAAGALAAAILAYAVHALVDLDWDFVAVTAPLFAVAGVLLAAGRPVALGPRRSLAAAASALLGAVALFSLTTPWLAQNRVGRAYDLLGAGDAPTAVSTAQSAARLNPLALDPLLAEADAQTAAGNVAGARETLLKAVELQPRNWRSWYALGSFDFLIAKDPHAAKRTLDPAYALNAQGPAGPLLDEVRAVLEGRAKQP
jgi:O-Antigen ligase